MAYLIVILEIKKNDGLFLLTLNQNFTLNAHLSSVLKICIAS